MKRWRPRLGVAAIEQPRGAEDRLWQLRVAVSNADAVRFVLVILAGVTAALLVPHTRSVVPLVWAAGVVVWACAEGWLRTAWVKPRIAPDSLVTAERATCVLWAIGMTIWSCIVPLAWTGTSLTLQSLVLLTTGFAAVSVGLLLSPCRILSLAASMPFALNWTWIAFQPESFLHHELICLVLAFFAAILTLTGHFFRHGRSALRLEAENKLLVDRLNGMVVDAEAARRKAERSNEAKSTFLANMSHEIRTPLNAILGFSEIIRDEVFGSVGTSRYRDYAADIHRSGAHLLEVVNDILDLSRIEAGEREMESTRVDVAELVDSLIGLFSVAAREAGIVLVRQVAPGLPRLWADERSVRQVMINLVANAIRFTPPGGRVTLGAGLTSEGGVLLRVIDTGAGISEDDLARVTQRFAQGEQTQASRQRGTGLGLAIVEELVKLHGARLVLKSKLGKGTQADVNFPAERAFAKDSAALYCVA